MWVITTRGFFSAVQKPEDRAESMVTVRARNKADIDALAPLVNAQPYRLKTASDYPWRLRCTQEQWALACFTMAWDVDYPNFKNEVARVQGKARHDVYSRVWSVLLSLERRGRRHGWDRHQPLFVDDILRRRG